MNQRPDTRVIRVQQGNLAQGHLYVTEIRDFLPKGIVGGNTKDKAGTKITIHLDGLGGAVETDIASDGEGRPRGHFRARVFKPFYRFHRIQEGDELGLVRLGPREYRLSPFSRGVASAFSFIDLFAGIGGLRMGFEAAGGRCVFTSEWNSYSQQTYRANFPDDHEIAGDITKIHTDSIPSHDVLLAGFPCQPFSIAGVSKKNALGRPHGFHCATQGTLFFDVVRILDAHRPQAFLLENVKNLLNHDHGRTFNVIRETLEQLGYTLAYRVLDAKRFVPQHRERIFIVGFRESSAFSFNDIVTPEQAAPTLRSILHAENGSEMPEKPYTEGPDARVAQKYTLTDHLWRYLQAYAAKHQAKGNGFGFGLVGPDDVARTLSARYYKDGSEILVRQPRSRPRRLTPRECARLMGFDVPGRDPFKIVVSDTQAYKQFGNAVVVPVIEAIAKAMRPHLETKAPALRRVKRRLFEMEPAQAMVANHG